MKYTYIINSESKTIAVITIGNLEPKEVAAMELKMRLNAKDQKYKIIFDYRLSKNRISIIEAYSWFSIYYENINRELKYIPSAYLVNKEDWDFYSFFECTSINKGIPIKVFQEENAVLKWLES